MLRPILFAAAAAATISFAAPAQAMMADSGLGTAAVATVQPAAYWDYHHRHYRHSRGWRHSYAYSPYRHRHCWSVQTWHGWVRRCSW